MKTFQINLVLIIFVIAGLALGCKMFGGSDTGNAQNTNSNAGSNVSPPAPTATPRTFEPAILVAAVKANESELAKMLGKDPVAIIGDVWKGGDYSPASIEYWGREGRITCSGFTNTLPPEKKALWIAVEKATGDYLNNRVKRMPIVKAKGIYKTSIPPSAKPNDYWAIYFEDCELMEVVP